jgi:hypothetical protein
MVPSMNLMLACTHYMPPLLIVHACCHCSCILLLSNNVLLTCPSVYTYDILFFFFYFLMWKNYYMFDASYFFFITCIYIHCFKTFPCEFLKPYIFFLKFFQVNKCNPGPNFLSELIPSWV